ncbi:MULTISPECIES: DUF461 domain-containing protein [Streptomyces]|uniref:Copper chaperone PCu(A)C n=1 Tax=Streptomyces lycii TaxID=2654337 RepID=A0ABQ7FE40_9ACTN|nr:MULTISPECIES: DUF461 domain-containing protein [Streptomyces]KAF4406649.1 copper chaperone PCu(A)C [Streptomyces lycii]PGH47047.1 DUF461 domain-containing protein [Streptomyces sp. Ru87]
MSSSLRRGALAAAVTAISIVPLSACGAGNDAATNQVRPDNAAVTVEDIRIQNANVITQPEGGEGSSVVSAKVFNNGDRDQTIESVAVPGSGGEAELSPAKGSGPITVPAGGSVLLGGEGNASVQLRQDVEPGAVQPLVFKLSETGDVRIEALVVPSEGPYKSFGPSSEPSEPASGTPSETESGSPTAPADGESPAAGETGQSEPGGDGSAQEDAANGAGAGAGTDEAAEDHAGH